MKKFKVLPIVLCCSLALSFSSMAVSAKTFDDVENDPSVSWAKAGINKMTDLGHIKGYEDGTFKPQRPVSKVESLLLVSRIMGVEDKKYADTVESAVNTFGETVKKYNNQYVDEISYLLYNHIITESELNTYAAAATSSTPLYRYQAATLIAKMMGGESISNKGDKLDYADANDIPSAARKYVEYVTENGYMTGMGDDENGKAVFSPNTNVTRAQMATLLARVVDKVKLDRVEGTVTEISADDGYLVLDDNGEEIEFDKNIICKIDGKDADISKIEADSDVVVTYIAGSARLIEATAALDEYKMFGVITQVTDSGKNSKLSIRDYEDTTNKASYPIAEDCEIIVKGAKATVKELKNNDFVLCVLENGSLTYIETREKSEDITGTLLDVEYDDDDHVFVTVADKENPKGFKYEVSGKGATVLREGKTVTYRELTKGDKVDVKLSYGKVTKITSSGVKDSVVGTVEEIVISKNPTITVEVNGKTMTYGIYSGVEVSINDEAALYSDLRPGNSVSLEIESSEARKIECTTSSKITSGELDGQVLSLNTTYKVIEIKDDNGERHNIYYNSKTTFLKKDGTNAQAKDVTKNVFVSVTGSENNGVFEASIIIIK